MRLLAVGVLALVLAGCGGGGDEESDASDTASPAAGECRETLDHEPRDPPQLEPPEDTLVADKTYRVVVRTSCGEFTITLDQKASPKATASFVALVEDGYFDNTTFHRIVPGFVIQAGDPTATGRGGPGYTTVDPPARNTRYTRGVVAMAKTGAEPPGAAGSQFFVVTAADATLPPDYAVIGRVTSGQAVVADIGLRGDPTTERPTRTIVIDEMTVETS